MKEETFTQKIGCIVLGILAKIFTWKSLSLCGSVNILEYIYQLLHSFTVFQHGPSYISSYVQNMLQSSSSSITPTKLGEAHCAGFRAYPIIYLLAASNYIAENDHFSACVSLSIFTGILRWPQAMVLFPYHSILPLIFWRFIYIQTFDNLLMSLLINSVTRIWYS